MNNIDPCEGCALRLANIKGYDIKGVGNPNFGNMIILPTVDKFAYKYQSFNFSEMVKKLNDIAISSTGVDLLSMCYVTPFIKCKPNKRIELDEQVTKRCMINLKQEFVDYHPSNILLLGNNVMEHFLQYSVNPDKVYIDIKGRRWFNNYSPGVMLYNPNLTHVFVGGFLKWFNAVISNNFSNYEK